MHWYLVHTKPRQEMYALQNLEQQGYECFLPVISSEKLRQGSMVIASEPLFPRYLFIRLSQNHSAKSWTPIRSTKGVSRLVSFGTQPAQVDASLITQLMARTESETQVPHRLFNPGDRVSVTDGVFTGIEGIYQMTDGARRALVLIEFLGRRPISLEIPPASLRKTN